MKRIILTASSALAALALTPAPALAQDEAEQTEEQSEMDEAMAMLGEMFKAEPLTEEQLARLPLAETIVLKMMPDGAMAEMMDGMFDSMLEPLMELGASPARQAVAKAIGVTPAEIDLTDEQAAEIASLFDPAWKERSEREKEAFPKLMGSIMSAMEPPMRKAMSELYAIHFNDTELSEIDAFFSTETGGSFARKSFTMASDPRIVSATMEAMPAMMEQLEGIEKMIEEASADLPAPRSYADLTDAEKTTVEEATGFSREDLEYTISTSSYEWDDSEEAESAVEEAADEAEAAVEG